ncbi:hypothetical protein CDES_13635 [Corynebacterium deserti GIMN1.010]|uniref:VanZ-like domain-containing protein n=1 Tax=Corynebacterium deserti GIMN1.010 TaxID=931089 RepID=A0A0M4CS34_9CORY|nr:VanZ family protein [Corynebacterium deserti]ALC07055.1 hypothetical protein CDES_13635 [Corynebacterium deserti GIMN1.010]
MRAPSSALLLTALFAYSAVMISLTMLKSFFVIGLLWVPGAHRHRSISVVPLDDFVESGSWFSPLFGYGGNFAFFVPFGVLLYALLKVSGEKHDEIAGTTQARNVVLKTTLIGAGFSLVIEVAQYLFRLGYSDIDDIIFNTLGAACGAVIAKFCGPRLYKVWVWLASALAVVFAILVALGPRLGDPDKVVELSSEAQTASRESTPPDSASAAPISLREEIY